MVRRRPMSHSDLFCLLFPLWKPNLSPALSWGSYASSLALLFSLSSLHLALKMWFRVGSSDPLYFWTLWMQSCSIFIVKVLALPSSLDVESLPLVKDILILSLQYLGPIGLKPSEYCATYSLDAALWWFLATSVDICDYLGCVVY